MVRLVVVPQFVPIIKPREALLLQALKVGQGGGGWVGLGPDTLLEGNQSTHEITEASSLGSTGNTKSNV